METSMSTTPEQIGDLSYVPNPEYPYPFPVERAPHFWMSEQTGKLAVAVESYFNGEKLSPEALDLIKQYLTQYVERGMLTGDANRRRLLEEIGKLRTTREIERYADEIADYGLEVF
jgi:hypothetical protein